MATIAFNLDKLKRAVRTSGMSDREFIRRLKNENSKMTLDQVYNVNFGIKTLIDTCNLLGLPIDAFFDETTADGSDQRIVGDGNVITHNVVNSTLTNVQKDNETLRMLLDEKNKRIEDLKYQIDKLIKLLELGQKSDTNPVV